MSFAGLGPGSELRNAWMSAAFLSESTCSENDGMSFGASRRKAMTESTGSAICASAGVR